MDEDPLHVRPGRAGWSSMWCAASALVLLAGCGESAEPGLTPGRAVYAQPSPDGNTFACATCHALEEPASDSFRRVGHPIGDAARRPSYKNGQLDALRDAVNSCLTEWMNAPPLTAQEERWRQLETFLLSQAGSSKAEAVRFQIVQPPSTLDGGRRDAGAALFDRTCASCHGENARGTNMAPALQGEELDADYVARRIRLSGRGDSGVYDGLQGGIMPFWSKERLSDAELLDLVAFVVDISDRAAIETDASTPMDAQAGTGRECGSEHPMVGATGTLTLPGGTFHDVAGTVRVVDDCTLVIEDFVFDGGGIDVRIYGGVAGAFQPPTGFALSEDLLGRRFDGTSLTLTLPESRSLDDLDSVSVWCVAVGQDFGSTVLRL